MFSMLFPPKPGGKIPAVILTATGTLFSSKDIPIYGTFERVVVLSSYFSSLGNEDKQVSKVLLMQLNIHRNKCYYSEKYVTPLKGMFLLYFKLKSTYPFHTIKLILES